MLMNNQAPDCCPALRSPLGGEMSDFTYGDRHLKSYFSLGV